MNAATILDSDVLDIIFENRNKQYGAYSLRKEYNSRLYRSLGVVMGIALLLVAGNYIRFNPRPDGSMAAAGPVKDSIEFTPVDMPRQAPPPPPPAPPPSGPRLPAIKDMVPLIVKDDIKPDTIPTAEQVQNNVISDRTVRGEGPVSDNSGACNGVDKGSGPAAAPPELTAPEEPSVIEHADVMPEFPGGMAALLRFLGRNLQVPEEGLEPGQRVRVPVKFVVDKEGAVTDIDFLVQTDNVYKKEILRVIHKMPRWKPGLQHGKAVAVYYTIPIIFELTDN